LLLYFAMREQDKLRRNEWDRVGRRIDTNARCAELLYGVTSSDPVTFVAVCMLLIAAACIATYVPARRPMRVE
jgi:hypothetical protein